MQLENTYSNARFKTFFLSPSMSEPLVQTSGPRERLFSLVEHFKLCILRKSAALIAVPAHFRSRWQPVTQSLELTGLERSRHTITLHCE